MRHQSLYRAYRPHTFKEIVGQEEVVTPLQSQLENKKIGHAYLFAGSRGLGKTSIARIFASELKIHERDVYELDAASNNGVDEMRNLNDSIYTLPFASEYKMYILDEAHMLSKGAWNALLKTLEEPPQHVIIVLATTELDKVPETVRSRCQVFVFKKPTRQGLAKLVQDVSKKEGVTIEPAAAELIALLGDGSYRDALSVLEKALSVGDGKTLSREQTEQATGAPRHALVHGLVEALSFGDTGKALLTIHTAEEGNIDMQLYLMLVLEYTRQILLIRHAPDLQKEIQSELGEDAYKEAKAISDAKDSFLTHSTLAVFLDAAARIRFSPVPALPLELAVLAISRQD
ncbi:DNA polymerase III subunit gamma/tau [Patescibacteria group bacterium]|nr:DNA polymerase III subunit gamma/tau [Patescibacteria group bacterium]MBU1500824.1 DNA polymerase III subunit gamma/tau [Patescibacteria group bacterium]MBU2080879.1 DNA polymerase III subunit gamma/tau [Patescibacteria group bacterium]MBU2123984.1 DNA polymerase III subunit gamma/tau [Patescibacteria group bacterium]MBU2194725.1 DNA polymerase III subunit gamma/tau [Patescibacteria group bacterium]